VFGLKHLEECKLYIFQKLLVCRYFSNHNCDIISIEVFMSLSVVQRTLKQILFAGEITKYVSSTAENYLL
jgi:hypothetical protein